MNWLHCNACAYQLPSEGVPRDGVDVGNLSSGHEQQRRALFVTNCGHVFCQKCVVGMRGRPGSAGGSKCVVCPNTSVRLVQIGPRLKPEVRSMFDDCCKSIKSVYSTIDFQSRQAAHLIQVQEKTLTEMRSEMNNLKGENQQLTLNVKNVANERDKLKSEAIHMKKEIEELKSNVNSLRNNINTLNRTITTLNEKSRVMGNNRQPESEQQHAMWSHQEERTVIEGNRGGFRQPNFNNENSNILHRTSTPLSFRGRAQATRGGGDNYFNNTSSHNNDFLKTPAAFKSKGVFSQYPNSQMMEGEADDQSNPLFNRSRGNQSLDRTIDKVTRNLNFNNPSNNTAATSLSGGHYKQRQQQQLQQPFRHPHSMISSVAGAKRRIQPPPPQPTRKKPTMDQTEIFPF